MELLAQLGINSTVVIQFCVFVVTILILRYFVFSRYAAAANSRYLRTRGGENDAAEMTEKTALVQADYEKRARELNAQINQIFQKEKSDVAQQADQIISDARLNSSAMIEATRKRIKDELESAESEIKKETQSISALMVKKLLGKPE